MYLLFLGVDAVLGPANITKDDQIPIEQCISTCKLRPGSGCLGVKILADGPTRVLEITDCLQQVRRARKCTSFTVRDRGIAQKFFFILLHESFVNYYVLMKSTLLRDVCKI